MSTIEEKRIYGDREGATEAYVAASAGVVRVRIAGDVVGEFALLARCDARDVAAGHGRVAVATDEDVLVRSASDARDGDGPAPGDRGGFDPTGFGPARAVGFDGETPLAADADGRVARLEPDGGPDPWLDLEPAVATGDEDDALAVRAVDGDLVATDRGVCRVRGDRLARAGLEDAAVRDVSAAGVPLAATAAGLYRLANGWLCALEGDVEVVAADPRGEPGRLGRAHAAAGLTVYEYAAATDPDRDATGAGEWRDLAATSDPVVDVAYGETTYAVTGRGTLLARRLGADPGDGWRSRALGVGEVRSMAIPTRAADREREPVRET